MVGETLDRLFKERGKEKEVAEDEKNDEVERYGGGGGDGGWQNTNTADETINTNIATNYLLLI